MGRGGGTFAIASVLSLFLVVACGEANQTGYATDNAGASISGPYSCGIEQDPDAPVLAWEFRADGTLSNVSPPDIVALGKTAEEKIVRGTWSATGGSGRVTSANVDYPFTIDGDQLVFQAGKFVCRPAGPPPGDKK